MELLHSSDFSNYVDKLVKRHHVTGLAVALVQDRRIASRGFGKASLHPPRDFTPDSLICVGSASKSLTAGVVAQLVGDNERYPEVQYGATMAGLLPGDFVMSGQDHENVTLEDVLSHQTGMPPHELSLLGPKAENPDNVQSITRNLRNLTPLSPNRAEFIYCNMMYSVAVYLVEQKTQTTFADFLHSRLLQPLHMDSTCLLLERVQARGLTDRVAVGYLRDKKAKQHTQVQHSDTPESQGAGQIFSSVNDYAKWIKAMIYREGPITEDIFKGLTTRRVRQEPLSDDLNDDEATYYAFGWDVRQYQGYTLISHDGGDVGYQCNHFFILELEFGGAIFSNSDHADMVVSQLMYRFIDEVMQGSQSAESSQMDIDNSDSEPDSDSDVGESDEEFEAEFEEELRRELCPGIDELQPQEMPLSAYIGKYWNPGYRGIKIEEKDGSLFIDATDRSVGFTLAFKHICEQTKYLAYMSSGPGDADVPLKGEFVLENNKAIKLGLQLEERFDGYIWFARIDE
ncbi:D-aminopeptidase-like protein [Cladobotryum mycophilum]|uniref:D-aminopeptidase-like protein n=1 Tax=Cladobotryum mycophilum TaxID=491253 RepID=A0ABR0SAY7_9HYPO